MITMFTVTLGKLGDPGMGSQFIMTLRLPTILSTTNSTTNYSNEVVNSKEIDFSEDTEVS